MVHVLQFASKEALAQAYQRLGESEHIDDCLVESDARRIRFLASHEVAKPLLERLYLDGDLTWCSRHPLTDTDGER